MNPRSTTNPISARQTGRSAPGAFTLIEVILAIGVTSMVLIAINAVFFTALRLHRGTTDVVEASVPIQQTLATMRRDLQGAMAPSAAGVLSGDFKAGGVNSAGQGQPVDLELYTTTGVLREEEPWSEVQKVTYELRPSANRLAPGRDLFRSVTRNLLSAMPQPPNDEYLMSGIESLELSCYDGATWNSSWDSTVVTNLPLAVRVKILLANAEGPGSSRSVEMLVPIDSQTHTNQ